jgi:CRP-like cAMP-binding protein
MSETPGGKAKSNDKKGAVQHTLTLPAREYVFREGDLGTEMFIVHEGKVEVLKNIQGAEKRMALLEKGDFFGEMSLLEDLPRTASARALTDCSLVRINGTTFDQMLRTNPEIAIRLLHKLSRRLRETDRLLAEGFGTPRPADGPVTVLQRSTSHRLVHARSGMEFRFAAQVETTVGRVDPVTGTQPEIDLSPLDLQRSVSRRHAQLFLKDSRVFVVEEIGTINGTFVNSVRVETGVPVEVRPGDEVRFGLVDLVFNPE